MQNLDLTPLTRIAAFFGSMGLVVGVLTLGAWMQAAAPPQQSQPALEVSVTEQPAPQLGQVVDGKRLASLPPPSRM